MSDQTPNAPVPADEGENTTSAQKKPSLWSRAKARKANFVADHPFAAELGRQTAYGVAYLGGILLMATVYGAVTGKAGDDETPELEASDSAENDILSDEEE
jgi:hypothetical protein|uniref:Uncharacterized protein n=1 Tax=Siphoviridae sp. ctHEr2 TaxID=2826229 RepID=A0A8S5NEP2_9CAUD|nr:MAG TPA: hypothetical protein [Siphoviridae sp. ctHEr2]